MRQKTAMIACHEQAKGNSARAAHLYASFEQAGLVHRESNIQPLDSYAYATILWHTGKRLGWYK